MTDPDDQTERDARAFGSHVRSLRLVRGLTQEALADRCGLSADTIRRIEHAAFSPSLITINKLCSGLGIERATLFASLDSALDPRIDRLVNALSVLTDEQVRLLLRLVTSLQEKKP